MIGTLPVAELAPLEHRYALDGAVALLGGSRAPLVYCQLEPLAREVRQRLPAQPPAHPEAGLWVEPGRESWLAELRQIREQLPPHGQLVIVMSQPLARLLPERRSWPGQPLGVSLGGPGRLMRALHASGFQIGARYGMHSLQSMIVQQLAGQLGRWGQPALADRLHFAARLRYQVEGRWSRLGTVALLQAVGSRGR